MKHIGIKTCWANSEKTSNPENLFDDLTWLTRDQAPRSLAQCILGHCYIQYIYSVYIYIQGLHKATCDAETPPLVLNQARRIFKKQ